MDHEAAWRLRVGRMDVELRELVRQHERGAAKLQLDVADAPARLDEAELLGGAEDVAVEVNRLLRGLCAQDRKSVVEGKGVSGRVEPGGRRIIQKKKKTQ